MEEAPPDRAATLLSFSYSLSLSLSFIDLKHFCVNEKGGERKEVTSVWSRTLSPYIWTDGSSQTHPTATDCTSYRREVKPSQAKLRMNRHISLSLPPCQPPQRSVCLSFSLGADAEEDRDSFGQ
jgi:hypothetical protein